MGIDSKIYNFKNSKKINYNFNPELFLLHSFVVLSALNTNTTLNVVLIQKSKWWHFFFYKYLFNIQSQVSITDGVHYYTLPTQLTLSYIITCLQTSTRTLAFTKIDQISFECPTLTHLFKSTNWLERELSDFSGLYFTNSKDTRRLLLDYTVSKKQPQTHQLWELNYSPQFSEILLTL